MIVINGIQNKEIHKTLLTSGWHQRNKTDQGSFDCY